MTRSELLQGWTDELAGTTDLFRTVFETVRTGILLIDPKDGTIIGFNPAARELAGYPGKKMLGHTLAEFFQGPVNGGTPEPHLPAQTKSAEMILTHKNGTRIPVLLNPALSESGNNHVLVVTVTDLRDRVHEKAILLREIHHRVKNNMQLITGILHMEGLKLKDPSVQVLFENCQYRIRALAAVHEMAYSSNDFAHIPAGALITTITSGILASQPGGHGRIVPAIECGNTTLDLDTAVPFGILINELVSNSVLHAFPKGRNGHIEIRYTAGKDACILEYRDDGVGFPERVDFALPATTGLELIRGLTGELDGTVELLTGPGTRYRFTFPHKNIRGASS
jgi:two-component system, sensor histidine kinase PdtaS